MAKKGNGGGGKPKTTLVEKFVEYHGKRPDTYKAFRMHALRLMRKGHRHLSAQYICDYLAFETGVDMRPDEEYKLNHDYGPFYARMLKTEDEKFGPYFEFRASVADGVDFSSLLGAA